MGTSDQAQNNEFIEGRTPYRVDISAHDTHNPSERVSFTPTSNRVVFPTTAGNYDARVAKSLGDTNTLFTNTGDGDNEGFLNTEQEFIQLPFDRVNGLHVNVLDLPLQGDNGGDDWELKLLGAEEQCGPDRRRDSYGVCQFINQM
jgi:hypothetical protein